MKKMITKAMVIALVGTMGFMATGCYGPFRLTSKLHDWNGRVSQKKFVNELVFLGMCILPVYEICILGDGLIFNSIEWWGGRNPITMKDGQREETRLVHNGLTYQVIKTRNNLVVAEENGGRQIAFRYFPEEKAWYQMEGENKVKVVELKGKKVFAYLPEQKTLVFDKHTLGCIEPEMAEALAVKSENF